MTINIWGQSQVNMVCHEHPGMDVDAEPRGAFEQPMGKCFEI